MMELVQEDCDYRREEKGWRKPDRVEQPMVKARGRSVSEDGSRRARATSRGRREVRRE